MSDALVECVGATRIRYAEEQRETPAAGHVLTCYTTIALHQAL